MSEDVCVMAGMGVSVLRLVVGAGMVLAAIEARAAVLLPTALTVSTLPGSAPAGTNASGQPIYTDDVFLESLTFAGASFSSADAFRAAKDFTVNSGRGNVNVEWGDDDGRRDPSTGDILFDDGDPDPITSLGRGLDPEANKETTDPEIQDAALRQVFNSLSLSELTDGENGAFVFTVLFENGLTDDNPAPDAVPEIIFIERGGNDTFDVRLITGGTFDAPDLTSPVRMNSATFWDSGILIDTTEISGPQRLAIGGFDLNDFGLASRETVFGFELTRVVGGPDLNGFFLSAEDGSRFVDPLPGPSDPVAVPLPAAAWLLLGGFGVLGAFARRRGSAGPARPAAV